MRLGVFAKTFAGEDPWTVLSAARSAGYESVQYNMACSGLGALPAAIPHEAVTAVRAASEETGVALAAVSATYNMIHPDPAVREAGRLAFGTIAAAARDLGTSVVTLCTGSRDAQDQWRHHPDNASPAAWDAFRAELGRLLDLADRHGVTLGVEPEPGNVVSSPAKAREMIEAFGDARLGIVLDPANLFETAEDLRGGAAIDEALDLLGPWVVLAHAKDRAADGRIVRAGEGVVDFRRFVARLRAQGFGGDLVTHGLEAAEAPAAATHLRAEMGPS